MKKALLISSILLLSIITKAQFRHTFTSFPDSAKVLKNGVLECHTPCRVKWFWRDAEDDKMVFSVEADGFKTWSDTLRNKPFDFDEHEYIDLEPAFTVFEFDSASPLLAFDKLMVNFKDGSKIGEKIDIDGNVETIKWKGSIKVGDEVFEEKFFEIITNMGYVSQVSKSAELFSNDTRSRIILPRYIIGVELTDYNLNYQQIKDKDYGSGDVMGENTISFEWKVLDKKSGNVVLTYKNTKKVNYRQQYYQRVENNREVYELALIDFLESDDFVKLIRENKPINEREIVEDKKMTSQVLSPPQLPSFNQFSDMIQYANKSCVTIITDGGHGSGVIVDPKGLVLSAYHVVEGVNQIDVKFSSGLTLQAEVISYDELNDVVLLDIVGEGFQALPLSKSDDALPLGSEVATIGTPFELELGQSISKGILSGKRKKDERIYLQADISVSPGNSGGPLLNAKGEVIGIVQSKVVKAGVEGIGFAIPIKRVKEQLGIAD